jgi:uroporphyrinogen decarboxylase
MTPRERVLAALKFKAVDYIPVFTAKSPMGPALIGKKLGREYYLDPDVMARSELALLDLIDDDAAMVGASAGLQSALGANLSWPENDHCQAGGPSITSMYDVERLDNSLSKALGNELLQASLEVIRRIRRAVGDRVVIETGFWGAFTSSSYLLGADGLMGAVMRCPELVHKLCGKIVDLQVSIFKYFVEAGADIISLADPMSSPTCISPSYYTRFALPYLTRAVQGIQNAGAFVRYHPCGGEYPIIDQVGLTGADILHLSELVDIDVAQKIFFRRHVVSGGVDPTNTLYMGDTNTVDLRIRELIGKLKHKTGVIIRPGCGLSPNIRIENLQAMVRSARKYSAELKA